MVQIYIGGGFCLSVFVFFVCVFFWFFCFSEVSLVTAALG